MINKLILALILALSPTLWSSASAQRPITDAGSASPKDKSIEDKYRSDEFERVRREAYKREERSTARFPEIKQDFERIQELSTEVLQASLLEGHLDYALILQGAKEIRKRATRLKSNLFPLTSSDGSKQIKPKEKDAQDLKSLVIALDKSITRFVHNPIFENIKVVTPQDSTNAERELERVIKLSANTVKKVE